MPSPRAATSEGGLTSDLYGVSAGLDLLSGVFGYLNSINASAIAQSRADLMRVEATANAQRYQEQATQFEAKEKVMYLSSGVKLSGSPIDALATEARVASENVQSILMHGQLQAADQSMMGIEAEMKGRDALIGGLAGGAKAFDLGFGNREGGGGKGSALSMAVASGSASGGWNSFGGVNR